MRLSEQYQKDIKESFREHFLPEDHLWLFGSRVYDDKKCGDIDLYIETHHVDGTQVWNIRFAFWRDLQRKLGEQKIDIVVKYNDLHLPIHDTAKQEGVVLV